MSLVTPSFEQGEFLEETIRSVLLQSYPRLEYVVLDGGSSDESVAILQKYEPWLSAWRTEPDGGQYDAVNRGLQQMSGEIMAWINADDRYAPNALTTIAEVFTRFRKVDWLTTLRPLRLDRGGTEARSRPLPGFHREPYFRGEYVAGVAPFHSAWIPQESTFWRRRLWEAAGGFVDDSLRMAGDFELWSRFYRETDLVGVAAPLAAFRFHSRQKTARDHPRYVTEAEEVLCQAGGGPQGGARALARMLLTRLPEPLRRLAGPVGLGYRGRIVERDPEASGWVLRDTVV